MVIFIVLLVFLGLLFGSFLNAFVWRHYRKNFYEEDQMAARAAVKESTKAAKSNKLQKAVAEPTKEELSIVHGRSMCTHCHHTLAPKDLMPVVSYLLLRGRCRYCRERIQDSPLAELLLPALWVLSYLAWPLAFGRQGLILFVFWVVIVGGLVALTVYDLRWQLLPHSIVLPLIGVAAAMVAIRSTLFGGGWHVALNAALGAVIVGGLFYVLFKMSDGRWIGGGDITLGVLLGLLAGGPAAAFLVIFSASLFGTAVSLPLLVMHKADLTSKLPFGPFLIAGGILAVLYAQPIFAWYSSHLLFI